MRDYGKISTSLWGSQKWSVVSDDGRLLYLYLHTCPHVNSVGCFVLREGYACTDLGWKQERYRKAMENLCARYLVGADASESLVRIIDFLKHDPFTNPKHADGAIRIARKLPDCHQKLCLFREISQMKHVQDGHVRGEIHSLGIAYGEGRDTQNPLPEPFSHDQEPEMDNEPEGSLPGLDLEAQEPEESPAEAFAAFNASAQRTGWPVAKTLTPDRRKVIIARVKEAGGIEGWYAAMMRAEDSDFLSGRSAKAFHGCSFDWITKKANFTKLIEGNYDNRTPTSALPQGRQNRSDPALENILRIVGLSQAPGDGRA